MNNTKETFKALLRDNELWLMNQILKYAKKHNYTKYTSTLLEPWRISIEGLSESFCLLLDQSDSIPEFDPDDNYQDDPASQFGLKEAKLHRSRGVNYAMFTSLLKYYRQSYIDLIKKHKDSIEDLTFYKRFMHRFFDRIEIAYATEWNGLSSEMQIHELSMKNRDLANEKNLYLTIFESFGSPAFLIGENKELINYNSAAAEAFNLVENSGYYYYNEDKELIQLDVLDTAISHLKEKNSNQLEYFHALTSHYYLVRVQKLKDISDKFYGYVVLFNDITELRQKDEMLIAQSRLAAMGEMLSMIAHQWRQPLASISMSINNMLVDIELEMFDTDTAKSDLNDMINHNQHLSQTIDDFRNFFKPDKDSSTHKIKDVLEQTYSIIKDSLANNNIKLITSYKSESEIDLYPRELMQVFVNIINNAKDALALNHVNEAFIEIKLYENDDYVITEISDNANGIDEQILTKIFDPYFSTKDEKNGTGLGLYMSKMIVERNLHGKIKAFNTENGTCFRVMLKKMRV